MDIGNAILELLSQRIVEAIDQEDRYIASVDSFDELRGSQPRNHTGAVPQIRRRLHIFQPVRLNVEQPRSVQTRVSTDTVQQLSVECPPSFE